MAIPESVREVFDQGRDDNPASWRWIIAYFEYVTGQPNTHGQRCLPLLRLVQQLAVREEAQQFRAGQSLLDLLISTKAHHGLDADDPYVRVAADWQTPTLRVEYWLGNQVGDLVESHTVDESQVVAALKPLLARLRSETQEQGA